MSESNPYLGLVPDAEPAAPAAAAPSSANPYDGLLDDQAKDDATARKFTAWRATAQTSTPEHATDVLQYSAAAGLDPKFVSDNLDQVKQQVDQRQLAETLRTRPGLAKYLADAGKAPLVKDDAAALGWLEWAITGHWDKASEPVMDPMTGEMLQPSTLTTGPAPARALKAGIEDLEASHLATQQLLGNASLADRVRLNALELRGDKDFGGGWLAHQITGGLRMAPMLAGRTAASALAGLFGRAAGGMLAAETGPGAAVAAGVGGKAGEIAGGAAFDAYMNAGPLYRHLLTLQDEHGDRLLEPEEAHDYAILTSLGSAGITAGVGGKVASMLPGVKPLLARIAGEGIAKALTQQTTGVAVKNLLGKLAGHVGAGVTYMAAQSAANAGAVELAKSQHGQDADWGNVATAAAHGAQQFLRDGLLLAAWQPGGDFLHEVGLGTQLHREANSIEVLTNSANGSKLFERAPEEAQKLISGFKQEQGAVENVYVEREAWDRLWQNKKADPREAASRVLGDDGKGYDAAVQSGGDLVVPVEAYLAKVARTPAHEALRPDIRLSQNGLTPRQGQAAAEQLQKRTTEIAKSVKAGDPVYDAEFAKARSAGQDEKVADAFARLRASNVAAMAERYGGTPAEWYQRLGSLELTKGEDDDAPAMARAAQPGGMRLTKDGERGYIEFGPQNKPARYNIHLLENADPSTPFHELGHFFTDALSRIASGPDAPPDLRADMEALAKSAGYSSLEERTAGLKTENEEHVSHAFEQYLAEGKAPAAGLSRVFERFRLWMLRLYRSSSGVGDQYRAQFGRPLNLSDEVRSIFHRWLAADDAVHDATRDAVNDPLPDKALASMTEKERLDYQQLHDSVAAHAQQELVRRMVEEGRRESRSFLPAERKRMAAAAEARLDADPAYRALSAAQDGELRGVPLPQGIATARELQKLLFPGGVTGIDRAAAEEIVGPWLTDYIDRQHRGLFAKKGGAHPDALAAVVGAPGGAELLASLKDLEPRAARIAREVKEGMNATYGPALVDNPQKLLEDALAATHDDEQARKVLLEARALRRQLDPTTDPRVPMADWPAIQATAERAIQNKRVSELRPDYYLAAERASARRSLEAANKGDWAKAYDEKESQALSQALWRAARDAQDLVERLRDQLEPTDAARAKLGKAGPEFLAVHDALLASLGISDAPAGNAVERLGTLDALMARADKDVLELDFDTDSLKQILAYAPGWKDLPLSDAQNVADAVKNIKHIAAEKNEITLEGKQVSFDEVVKNIVTEAQEMRDQGKPLADLTRLSSLKESLLNLQAWDAALLTPETVIRWLGPTAGKVFWDRYVERRNFKDTLSKKVLGVLEEHWNDLPKELQKSRYELVDGLDKTMPIPEGVNLSGKERSRQWLWMVALNMGNQSNKDRLLKSYGWEEGQVLDVLRKEMRPEEWKFVQGIWGLLDKELWPQVADKQQRTTGLAPEKIAATPIFDELGRPIAKGGYFPAKYDSRASPLGERQSIDAVNQFYPADYARATTAKSHTKERSEGTPTGALDLNFYVVPSHMAQVVHDLAFDEFIRDTGKLLLDPNVKQTLGQRLGEEIGKQPYGWLQAVAGGQSGAQAQGMARLVSSLGGIKNAIVKYSIVGSIPVALAQFSHPLVAMAAGKVSPRYAIPALGQVLIPGKLAEILSMSPELQHRVDNPQGELQKFGSEIGRQGPRSTLSEGMQRLAEVSGAMMEGTDRLISSTIWLGKYNESAALGHDAAVKVADQTVRELMPSRDRAEQSAFLRNPVVGQLLAFHGFFNKVYNINRNLIHDAALAVFDPGTSAASATWTVAKKAGQVLAVLAAMKSGEYLAGHGKEEDEDWGQYLARNALGMGFQTLPFVGAPADALAAQLVTGKHKQISARQAPVLAGVEEIFKSIGKLVSEDKSTDEEKAFSWIETLVGAAGGPAHQSVKSGKYAYDVAAGNEHPDGIADVAGGLIYGRRDKQPSNPLTDLRDALH